MIDETTPPDALRSAVRECVAKELASSTRSEWLTYQQAADWLGCERQTVKEWVRRGDLKAYGHLRTVRVRRSDVTALMAPREFARA